MCSITTDTSVPRVSVLCAGQLRATRSSIAAYRSGRSCAKITRTTKRPIRPGVAAPCCVARGHFISVFLASRLVRLFLVVRGLPECCAIQMDASVGETEHWGSGLC
jgi:hypothetical protein